jgi:hypothetical integral membrane protein (TIGR02206 family)
MRLFSPEHLAAIAATAVLALLLTVLARRARARAPAIARALAVAILAGYVAEQLSYLIRGTWSVRVNLPLHLSDAVTLVSIAALWRPRPGLLTELVWFWALSASLQAVLTPDLNHTFPDVLFLTYFVTHSGAIAAACLLVIGMRLAPRPGAALRAFACTLAVAVLAAAGCLATGGNYMFLRRKPSDGSVLDLLGPWPWYIAGAAALGLALLLVLQMIARALAPR